MWPKVQTCILNATIPCSRQVCGWRYVT